MDKYAGDILHEFPDEKMYFFGDPVMPYYDIPVFAKVITHPKHRKALAAWKDALERFIESIRAERTALSYRGISFADVLAGKIYYAIGNFMVNSFLWEKELDKSLNRLGPAVIVTNGTRPDDTILAALGSRKNIRTVLISHGSHVGPKDEYERIEWGEHGKMLLRAPFSALALQTPLAEDYLNAFPSKSETVRTGALLWGRPVNTARSEELFARMFAGSYKRRDVNVVLYAGTSKGSYALRFHVYETSDEYIQSIRDMIEAVKDMPETVLIVKFRPSPEISLEDLKSLIDFSGRVVLSVEEPFSDLLGMADLLVSFSSTTIEEALQNEIPVLLYGGNGRYRHIPAYEVSVGGAVKAAAVYHAEDPGSLRYAIDNIVALKKRREIDKTLFSPYMYDKSDRAGPARLLGVG
jgi:hypothetical protein